MVAVDGRCHSQISHCTALGGQSSTVSADGVAQHSGGVGGDSVGVNRSNIDILRQVLGCNAANVAAVLLRIGAFQLHRAGGMVHSEYLVGFKVSLSPVVQSDAIHRCIGRCEEVVDLKGTLEGHSRSSLAETLVVGEDALLFSSDHRYGIGHIITVLLRKCLLFVGQECIDQIVSVVTEVHLCCSTVVQHGNHQCLCTFRLVAVKDMLSIGHGAVFHGLTVDIGAVCQLSISTEVDGIAHILGRNTIRGNHVLSIHLHSTGVDRNGIVHRAISLQAVEHDQTHVRQIHGLVKSQREEDIVVDLLLEGQACTIQLHRNTNMSANGTDIVLIAVTQNRDLFLSGEGLTTDRADHAVGQTGFGAGGSLTGHGLFGVGAVFLCIAISGFALAVGDLIDLRTTEDGMIVGADGLTKGFAQQVSHLSGGKLLRAFAVP